MYLVTLGGPVLEGSTFRRSKPLLLLTYLVLEGPMSRRRLAELFWRDARDARDSLSTTIRRLNGNNRKLIQIHHERVEANVGCDALDFRHAIRQQQTEAALALYRGAFLGALDVALSEEVEEWVYATREQLANLCRQAHLQAAKDSLLTTNMQAARAHAEAALDTPYALPLEQAAIETLHGLLVAVGSPRTPEVRRLAEDVGIGLHGSVTLDPTRSEVHPSAGAGVPTTLTSASTPFVGRHEELVYVAEALNEPHVRLLTLHGLGGVGKSRLATQAAQDALDNAAFEDGVHLVPLETLTNPDQIPYAIANHLTAQLLPHAPPSQQLSHHIGTKNILLILDNAEHVLPFTDLVNGLLQACPNLKLLVTSRVTLNAQHEHVLRVTALPTSSSGDELPDAQRLFLNRARKTQLDYSIDPNQQPIVTRICRLVDGLPLSIELAATWVHALRLEDIAKQLQEDVDSLTFSQTDGPERHRSLRTVFDHSWKLLSSDAQAALRRLAVFHGGFTREAAQQVADVSLGLLRELLDAALIGRSATDRFERHPLVFEMTLELLHQNPAEERAHRERHASYFIALLVGLEGGVLRVPELHGAANAIDMELPNIRQAWIWVTGQGETQYLALCCFILVFYAEFHGRYKEVQEIYQIAIDNLEVGHASSVERAAAMAGKAYTQFRMGELTDATKSSLAALATTRHVGTRDARLATFVAGVAGATSALAQGAYPTAATRIGWAMQAAQAEQAAATTTIESNRGDVMAGAAHEIHGMIDTLNGNFDGAMAHLEAGVILLRRHDSPLLSNVLWHLGQVSYAQGELSDARAHLEEALELARRIGYKTIQAYITSDLAKTLFDAGELNGTVELCEQVLQLAADLHVKEFEVGAYTLLGRASGARSAHRQALKWYEQALASAIAAESSIETMNALVAASESLAAIERPDLARSVLAFVADHPSTPHLAKIEAQESARRLEWDTVEGPSRGSSRERRFVAIHDISEALVKASAGRSAER